MRKRNSNPWFGEELSSISRHKIDQSKSCYNKGENMNNKNMKKTSKHTRGRRVIMCFDHTVKVPYFPVETPTKSGISFNPNPSLRPQRSRRGYLLCCSISGKYKCYEWTAGPTGPIGLFGYIALGLVRDKYLIC